MKFGEKKQLKFGKWDVTIERIRFDWKALMGWIIFIGIIAWFFWIK